MNLNLIFSLLEALLPTLVADGGKTISDVATGEGGIGKVTKVMGDLSTVLNHSATAVAAASAVAAQQTAPAPAPATPPAA